VTSLGLGLVPISAVLLVAGWAVSLFVMGLVLRFGNGAEAFAWGIFFVVMPLSGVFYPLSALPAFLRPVSVLLPTTHAFAAGRALVDGSRHGLGRAGPRRPDHRARLRRRPDLPGLDAPPVPPPRLHHALHIGGTDRTSGRLDQTRRRSVAQRVSSWRLESWSFRRTEETWVSTVFTERCSRRATSL